jgi:hypothetical protein
MATTTAAPERAPATVGRSAALWQRFVDTRPIGSLALVAVIATQLGTYFGYVFPAVGLPTLPWPLYNGILGTTIADGVNGAVVDEAFSVSANAFFVGHSLHFVNGIVFGILFGILARDMLPGPNTPAGSIGKGLQYGVIMTILSAGLLVPYAYVPEQGYGLFLFDGPDGWKLPFAILLWHLIYGAFLGALWRPTETVQD